MCDKTFSEFLTVFVTPFKILVTTI